MARVLGVGAFLWELMEISQNWYVSGPKVGVNVIHPGLCPYTTNLAEGPFLCDLWRRSNTDPTNKAAISTGRYCIVIYSDVT